MPLRRVAETRAAAAASIARIDVLIIGMERSLDAIEARLKRLTVIRKAASIQDRSSHTVRCAGSEC
jgi:hypothetical protein